jgi:hypothetical protein
VKAIAVEVRSGSFSEVGARNREVRFTPKNGHRHRGPSRPKGVPDADIISAENVGLCWSHWHLAMWSGRNAATMV